MRLLEETATDLPLWVRSFMLVFAGVFFALAWWLAEDGGTGPLGWIGTGLSLAVALVLLISAARGKMWRWMWLFPG